MSGGWRRLLLPPASALWSTANAVAARLSEAGVTHPVRFGSRVISVGNIQAGGAGKTPLVILLAKEALKKNLKTVVLCRGYKGVWELTGGVILPGDPLPEARMSGDEAALIHERVPGVVIGVGADRVAQYEEVVRKLGGKPDLVILDDGFQNTKIHKDLEIVALTSAGRSQVLYRDWPGALRRAGLLVWTKGAERPGVGERPLVRVHFKLPAGTGLICLVTGVGDADSVRMAAEVAGYQVVEHLRFADHAAYDASQLREFLKMAGAKGCRIATTGKDWVKWRELGISRDEVLVLEPEVVFVEGRELWERIVWG